MAFGGVISAVGFGIGSTGMVMRKPLRCGSQVTGEFVCSALVVALYSE